MNFQINVIPEWPTFISQLLSTAVLFIVVKHFLFKPISKMLTARKEIIENDMLDAKTKVEEAESLKNEYEVKISGVKNEARAIIASAKSREDKLKAQILLEAKKEADNIFLKAKNDIKREKEKTMSGLKHEIIEIAMLTASTALDKNLNKDTHQELITKFIDEIGEAEWLE